MTNCRQMSYILQIVTNSLDTRINMSNKLVPANRNTYLWANKAEIIDSIEKNILPSAAAH